MTLPENLERLLIDREMNELPEDARWLLERYLEERPEYRKEANSTRETLSLARRTLRQAAPAPAPLPEFPRLRPSAQHRWKPFALWPAICLFCLTIGWLAGQKYSMEEPISRPMAVVPAVESIPETVSVTPPAAVAAEPEREIWSVRRWMPQVASDRKAVSRKSVIEWEEPFKPRWKGASL
jgi:hypothetical protein